jgi:hypothetical protein
MVANGGSWAFRGFSDCGDHRQDGDEPLIRNMALADLAGSVRHDAATIVRVGVIAMADGRLQ